MTVVIFPGKTGPVVIDYKGDRIMDYDVWYLASGSNEFQEYIQIPLSKSGKNATACMEWLVCKFLTECSRLLIKKICLNKYMFICIAHTADCYVLITC